ncbi:hypothetical protein [Saccharomonospora piscinae]|uniref:hypothetical protein n=1 Tax=Saccharomonospora piscinae TaxID=687388 RepID=UPI0004679D16|nr:hypothetical protein [Saccharomonospora piscinae]
MLIVHRCECGHLADWHTYSNLTGSDSCSALRCDCASPSYGKPQVIPSWRGTTEGTWLDTTVRRPACECQDCAELFTHSPDREVA